MQCHGEACESFYHPGCAGYGMSSCCHHGLPTPLSKAGMCSFVRHKDQLAIQSGGMDLSYPSSLC